MTQRGFTLIEMLVVLVILTVLTTIAVRSVDAVQDQTRYESTQRALENVRESVTGPASQSQPDGRLMISGFVADLGRLPKKEGTDELTQLSQLWAQGTMTAFALQNCDDTPDGSIAMGCGWRGPYLRLPVGHTDFRDGWGNAYALQFDAQQMFQSIRSRGSDNADGATAGDVYSADLAPAPLTANDWSGVVSGMVYQNDGNTPAADGTSVRIFYPDPTTGVLTRFTTTTTGGVYSFAGVPIGSRIIRAGTGATLVTRYLTVPGGGLTSVVLVLK